MAAPRLDVVNSKSLTFGLAFLVGCGGSSPLAEPARSADREALEASSARVAELEAALEARRQEIRRLESEVALLRAERGTSRSVTLVSPEPAAWDEPASERGHASLPPPEVDEGPRVSLKLYGAADAMEREWMPPEPSAAPARTPVPEPPSRAGAPRQTSDGLSHYREALAAVRARDLEAALPLLDLAIERAPTMGARVDAVFWRGEVLYLLGRYLDAEVEFGSIVAADLEHARLPASLLRLGQCRLLRGLSVQAATLFERLRSEYPESHAAAQVPREGL